MNVRFLPPPPVGEIFGMVTTYRHAKYEPREWFQVRVRVVFPAGLKTPRHFYLVPKKYHHISQVRIIGGGGFFNTSGKYQLCPPFSLFFIFSLPPGIARSPRHFGTASKAGRSTWQLGDRAACPTHGLRFQFPDIQLFTSINAKLLSDWKHDVQDIVSLGCCPVFSSQPTVTDKEVFSAGSPSGPMLPKEQLLNGARADAEALSAEREGLNAHIEIRS